MLSIMGNFAIPIALGLVFIIGFGMCIQLVNGQGMTVTEKYYEIPSNRLPLRLTLNVTHDSSAENDLISVIQVSLNENNSEAMVQGVAYAIKLERLDGSNDAPNKGEIILNELFLAQNTSLNLVLAKGEGPSAIENGIRDDFLNAWIPENPNVAPLTLRSPLISENSTYLFQAEILTVDDVRNILAPDDIPKLLFTIDTGKNLVTSAEVVPEFPISVLIIFSLVLISIMVYQKLSPLKKQYS
jgi:hypothetical protein